MSDSTLQRDDVAMKMLAAWMNARVDQMPPENNTHLNAFTMDAWQRVADAAAAEERAKIVAWLRSDRIVLSMDGSKEDVMASAIEAGEHLK
jgi:hypothetical protein